MKKILCVIGTRPEAVKMAPVVRALSESTWARPIVVATAQHREMLDQMLDLFGVHVDHDLDLMRPDQTPSELMSRMLTAIDRVIGEENAQVLLAQGDTTTTFCASIAAFHRRIPFGHVEAGLRTGNLDHPFPEEGYRQMTSRVSRWNFAPTSKAADNLRSEGIDPASVFVTGNTCIDALLSVSRNHQHAPTSGAAVILLTAHRRENFGTPMRNICNAVLEILTQNPAATLVCPVHPNPQAGNTLRSLLEHHPRVKLIEPQNYISFVNLMSTATLILTDSGGIQEEAPALGKPVLVLRETTERPEAVEAGVAKLVGTDIKSIVTNANRLLQNPEFYKSMAKGASPYGDGFAAQRITDILQNH